MPLNRTEKVPVATLCVERLCKRFGDTEAVKDVSFEVQPGKVVSLLGPSGCGKTTVLRLIAGLMVPTSGTTRFDGEDVTQIPPYRRKVGMVFQNYALFPHMSVADNIGFGLKMQGVARTEIASRVPDALAMMRMRGMERRYPSELSGGQQQRVALARAIVTRPRLLLLDEPFGALDRNLREDMQIEVKQLQRELGLTFIFVTHDQEEALTLSDTIAVMRAGRIEQIGTPIELFNTPKTRFVAEFFGTLNTLPVTILQKEETRTLVDAGFGKWFVGHAPVTGGRAEFAVRTSDVRVSKARPLDANVVSVAGVLEDMIYRGSTVLCRVRLPSGARFTAQGDVDLFGELGIGDAVTLSWLPHKSFVFPPDETSEKSTTTTVEGSKQL